ENRSPHPGQRLVCGMLPAALDAAWQVPAARCRAQPRCLCPERDGCSVQPISQRCPCSRREAGSSQMSPLFPACQERRIDTGAAEIFTLVGGSGPPLLLLHGFPQTHAMWHRVAPALIDRFTCVIADLRGYGLSSCPANDAANLAYSKRAMAGDMVKVMSTLGHRAFSVVGHDRGGRVAYRMALDHPEAV